MFGRNGVVKLWTSVKCGQVSEVRICGGVSVVGSCAGVEDC